MLFDLGKIESAFRIKLKPARALEGGEMRPFWGFGGARKVGCGQEGLRQCRERPKNMPFLRKAMV